MFIGLRLASKHMETFKVAKVTRYLKRSILYLRKKKPLTKNCKHLINNIIGHNIGQCPESES